MNESRNIIMRGLENLWFQKKKLKLLVDNKVIAVEDQQ